MDEAEASHPTHTVRPAFSSAGLAGNSSRTLPPPAWVLPEESFDIAQPGFGTVGPTPTPTPTPAPGATASWPSFDDRDDNGRAPDLDRDSYPDEEPTGLSAAGAFGGGPADGRRLGLRAFDPGRRGARTLAAVAVVVIVFAAIFAWRARPRVDPVAPPAFSVTADANAADVPALAARGAASSAPAEVVVAVGGKVRKAGLVRLPPGARVADALSAAGGVDPGVDVAMLNLARKVVDGELILVGVTPPPGANTGPVAPAAAGGAPGQGGGPVNLNTATLADLDGLPGVGPVLAQRILDARDAQGGFTAVSDLRKVSGIGDARYEQLKDLVTV